MVDDGIHNAMLYQESLQLIMLAFNLVETKFGPNSSNPKAYHNLLHTQEVVKYTTQLADTALTKKKISAHQKNLLAVAAAFHDVEQDLGSGQSELQSGKVMAKYMQNFKDRFTPADRYIIQDIIYATTVSFDNGIQQSAAKNDYLAQIVADADLSSLGSRTPTYWKRAMGLFSEWYGQNATTNDMVKFLKHQIQILQKHSYYTPEAHKVFTHQPENLRFTLKMLEEARQPLI